MDIIFLCVVVFLFVLAVFDLSIGVSNDAVNFLTSAVGSKAASFKRILIVASIGVFIGAAMSNGMMDIARHGIFRPENFSFYDLICIFMAVMVTDIILLDIFNTLGMPTSTTVSMVFELLGATFVVALIKMAGGLDLGFNDLLNTEKALSVIIGIFLSVAIAFIFGTIVQFLARTIFSFNYKTNLKWKIGIFGGLCSTAIIYFLLLKGTKDLTFMTPEVKGFISRNTALILAGCMAFFTLLMQLLHVLKINVLKVVVLMGTFALAMAFAGNDLVNFIGIPLSGLSSYQDYIVNGGGDAKGFMMDSLNGPADTPIYFLIGAGLIMVVSLATSKKARNVTRTSISLGSQQGGDEMFGSSRIARSLVRWSLSVLGWVRRVTPPKVRAWFNRRFNVDETIMDHGAAFDLVRGSVNLVLAGVLIAFGTSHKLPLSTTFVTFMVAMGTSLADKAWGRESAVFRITGVISALVVITVFLIIRSNRRFRKKQQEETGDTLFQTILATTDKKEAWNLLLLYINEHQSAFLTLAAENYINITDAFINNNARMLSKADKTLFAQKNILKNYRRKETLCLRQVSPQTAMEKSAWFHLANNSCMNILYNLRRINEVCKEHVENNFHLLPEADSRDLELIRTRIHILFNDTLEMLQRNDTDVIPLLRRHCDGIKDTVSDVYHKLLTQLRDGDPEKMAVMYVYLNVLQETQEMVSALRKYLRAYAKLLDTGFSSRRQLKSSTL